MQLKYVWSLCFKLCQVCAGEHGCSQYSCRHGLATCVWLAFSRVLQPSNRTMAARVRFASTSTLFRQCRETGVTRATSYVGLACWRVVRRRVIVTIVARSIRLASGTVGRPTRQRAISSAPAKFVGSVQDTPSFDTRAQGGLEPFLASSPKSGWGPGPRLVYSVLQR